MTDAMLTPHPAAVDLHCWDCRANIVQIGSHREGWYWFQCPRCGLYIQTDIAGIGLSSTRNRSGLSIGERLHPDVFTPATGTVVTYATTHRCDACLGLYPAQVTRVWELPQGRKTLVERVASERLPGEGLPSPMDGRAIDPCRCTTLTEVHDTFDAILALLAEQGRIVIMRHLPRYPDLRYIFDRDRSYPAAEARAILARGTTTEPPRPDLAAAAVRLAWSDEASRGALYSDGDDWWMATVQPLHTGVQEAPTC